MRLMKRRDWNHHRHERASRFNYPSIPKEDIKCTACRRNRHKDNIAHTRVRGERRYHDDIGVGYGCPARKRNLPYGHREQTNNADGPLNCPGAIRQERGNQTARLREPRVHQQPPPHERDEERLIRPAELPDGEGEYDDNDDDEFVVDPSAEEAQQPRPTGRPGASRSPRPSRQPRARDLEHPIAPPEDADERDEDWSALIWKKSL